ncbi:MAG TPA: hypothetical protein VGF67_19940 [Ktedonobacteraceae bacterium]
MEIQSHERARVRHKAREVEDGGAFQELSACLEARKGALSLRQARKRADYFADIADSPGVPDCARLPTRLLPAHPEAAHPLWLVEQPTCLRPGALPAVRANSGERTRGLFSSS